MTLWLTSPPVPVVPRPPKPERAPVPAEYDTLASALAAIPNTDLPYDEWFRVACAVHYATDGVGLDLFREWSAKSSKHDDDFLDTRVWPYLGATSGEVVTERSLYALAATHGWQDPTIADDFDVVEDTPEDVAARKRFQFVQAAEFGAGKPASWIIKHVLPRAELIVLYGESGAGKSFMALDLMGAIARGAEWRGHKTTQGLRCGYIAAEGAAGFRNRLHAYARHHEIALPDLPIAVLTGAPSFLEKKDISALAEAMMAYGQIDVLVVDTLAQVTPGANENSSEDMGRAIKHCKLLHEATDATIILIHHSGKDAARGARGWSGLKGALDCELEVARCDDDRVLTISKIKDGPGEGQQYGFKLLDVPLGMDDDGDVYGSCVVEYSEVAVTNKKGGPRGKNEKIIYKIVLDLMEVGGDRAAGKSIIDEFKVRTPDLRASKEDRDLRDQVGKRTLGELVKKGFVVKFGEDYGLPKSGGGDEDA